MFQKDIYSYKSKMNTIICHPYRNHKWFLPFTIVTGMLALTASGYCMPNFELSVMLVAVGIGCAWLTKYLYDTCLVAVLFDERGFQVFEGHCGNYRYFSWEGLPYVYDTRSFKGYPFLVLSSRKLNSKETKCLANRGANLSRLCIDDVVVIPMDNLENVAQIKELIDKSVQ